MSAMGIARGRVPSWIRHYLTVPGTGHVGGAPTRAHLLDVSPIHSWGRSGVCMGNDSLISEMTVLV